MPPDGGLFGVAIAINNDGARFDPDLHARRDFMQDGTLRLIYTGALTPIYELDVVIRALARIVASRPEIDPRLDLYGRGDSEPLLRDLAVELGIADRVVFHGRIPIDDVPRAVAASDIGLAPTRLDPFTALTISTKVYEYAAMRKPVLASRLPLIERSFPDGSVLSYEPGDAGSLTGAILACVDDVDRRELIVAQAADLAHASSWENEAPRFVALVDALARDRVSH